MPPIRLREGLAFPRYVPSAKLAVYFPCPPASYGKDYPMICNNVYQVRFLE